MKKHIRIIAVALALLASILGFMALRCTVQAPTPHSQVGFQFPGTAAVGGLPTINVKDYGATGNGSTDDRAAIQSAFTAAANAGGGIVYFPPGTYIVSRSSTNSWSLDLTASNVTLLGVRGKSWIKHPTGLPATTISILRVDGQSNVTIRDLGFDGNWGNAATTINTGSNAVALPQATINVVSTSGWPSSPPYALTIGTGLAANAVLSCTGKTATSFTGCTVTSGSGTLMFGDYVGYTNSQAGINQSDQGGNPTNHAIMIRGSTNVIVENSLFQNVYGDGIWIGQDANSPYAGSFNVRILHDDMQMIARNGVSIAQYAERIYIADSTIKWSYQQDIDNEPVGIATRDVTLEHDYLETWWDPSDPARNQNLAINMKGGFATASNPETQTRKWRVRDCTMIGAVWIQDAADVVFDNNRIVLDWTGNSKAPVRIDHYVEDVWITNNYIYHRTTGDGASIAVIVYQAGGINYPPQGVHITRNSVHTRNGKIGILVQGTGGLAGVTGNATAITSTTFTDSGAAWTTNQWAQHPVVIGTGYGVITSNTATTATIIAGWMTPQGALAPTPSLQPYAILGLNGVVDIDHNLVELTNDGHGQGTYGIQVDALTSGMRVRVRENEIVNCNADGVRVSFSGGTMTSLELSRNTARDDQVSHTCANTINFSGVPAYTRLVMQGNSSGDNVTNVIAGLASGTWLVVDGAVPIWAGYGSPAGVVTAPVGSLYERVDGGAGTTLYVKESGTGNTGWVAK